MDLARLGTVARPFSSSHPRCVSAYHLATRTKDEPKVRAKMKHPPTHLSSLAAVVFTRGAPRFQRERVCLEEVEDQRRRVEGSRVPPFL